MRYVQSPNKHIIREELLEFSDSFSRTIDKNNSDGIIKTM